MIFLLVIAVVIFGAIVLAINGLEKLYKKGFKRTAFAIPVFVVGLIAYVIYIAIYPSNDYYKDEFETDLSTPFPKSATIIKTDATYPDIHGHFQACFAMTIAQNGYFDFKRRLDTMQDMTVNSNIDSVLGQESGSEPYANIMKNYNLKNIISVYSKKVEQPHKVYLIFFNDNKTAVFYRSSW